MPLQITCPRCQRPQEVGTGALVSSAECRYCGAPLSVNRATASVVQVQGAARFGPGDTAAEESSRSGRAPPPDLPPECQGLGPFVAEHRGGSKHHTLWCLLAPALLLAFSVPLACYALLALLTLGNNQPREGPLALAIVSVLLSALFLVALVVGVLRMRRRVLLFRDGVVSVRAGRAERCRWDDVTCLKGGVRETYVNGELRDKTCGYALSCRDGSRVTVASPLRGVEELSDAIEREVTRRLLPQAAEAMAKGETLQFGPISIDRQRIGYKGRAVPWGEVEEVQLRFGSVGVRRAGKAQFEWSEFLVNIPNARVLLALLADLREITT